MNDSSKYNQNWLTIVLILVFAIRVTSYFTLFPDSIGITRVVKIGLRLLMTFSSVLILMHFYRNTKLKYEWAHENFIPLFLYCLYLLLGIGSLLWTSSVAYSSLQLAMVIESLVFVYLYSKIIAFQNATSKNEIKYSFIFSSASFIIQLCFIIGLFINPDSFYRQTHGGEVSRLGGFIINPNELGMLGVLAACMALWEMKKNKNLWFHSMSAALSIAIILLTQSRSSLGALVLILAYFILSSGKKWLWFVSGSIGFIVLPIIINTIIIKEGDLEEVMSMTGRLPFWKDLINEGFVKEPWLGYGFMRISYSDKFDSLHAYAASMTHNTFIQVLLNLGLVGMFIVLFQMISTFWALSSTQNKELKILSFLSLIPLLINSMTEFGIFGESNYGILFYQFIILFLFNKLTIKPHV